MAAILSSIVDMFEDYFNCLTRKTIPKTQRHAIHENVQRYAEFQTDIIQLIRETLYFSENRTITSKLHAWQNK